MLKATRALISVYDKREVVEFARGLARLEIEMLSTGGTYRQLEADGLPVIPVADVTGFPEILGGRVKTLHPRIHGGILADRSKASHASELAEHDIKAIDLVVVNLYPFRQTASDPSKSYEQVVEMIDIGGPCMVRAAAKNHMGVVVVVDPAGSSCAVQDGSLAAANLMLAAHALGLGTCWINPGLDDDGAMELLGVPKGRRMICVLSLGYPAEAPTKERRKLADIAFSGKFGEKFA